MEKISKDKQNKRMTRQATNQTPTPNPAHDLKCVQCKSKDK